MFQKLPEWLAVRDAARALEGVSLRQLFSSDPDRAAKMTLEAAGWTLDFSKNLADERLMKALYALARACRVPEEAARMFAGDPITETVDRAVLHTALRQPKGAKVLVDGKDVMPGVREVLARMCVPP